MKTCKLDPSIGNTIGRVCFEASRISRARRVKVRFDFNGIPCIATPKKSPVTIHWEYWKASAQHRDSNASRKRRAAYEAEYQIKKAKRELAFSEAIATAPEKMSLRDAESWKAAVEKNSDPYGSCVMRYAELWARLMESQIEKGKTVFECASEMSHIADNEGITGFMYGCAVAALSKVWIHGEELRRWHNKDTQLGTEGDAANESGGVLNPALLTIGS